MNGIRVRSREAEEKIPVQADVYFVVDCPSLHLVPSAYLVPRKHQISEGVWTLENAFCPQCRQVVTRTRQIPSACFSEDVASRSLTNLAQSVTHFAVPSPAPTPVPSPGSSTRPPRFVEGRTEGRPESAQSTPSNSSMSPPPRWNSPLPAIEDVPIPEFRPFNRDCDLPEVVPDEEKQVGEPPPPPPPKPSTPAPPAASAKPSKFGAFFKRASGQKDKPEKLPRSDKKQERPKGSSRSVTSHDSVGAMLPKFMSFSFSATGKNLLAWKKESEVLVRIELETFGGRAIDLGDLLPQRVGERVVHIRHVVEGNEVIAAILSHNHDVMLLVLHESGLPTHASLRHLDTQQLPTCLAISPDNSFVAVGLGAQVLLLQYSGFDLQWGTTLTVPGFAARANVKFQTCNFSPDSSCLAVSTQRNDPRRSHEDDAVYTYIWACQPIPGNPTRLWTVQMPTDAQGLTDIQYLPSLNMGFVTGMTSTPYSLFLSPASQPLPQTTSKILEYRIRCSCFCPAPNSHILYFMDVQNKIYRVDLRARRLQLLADVNTSRGALRPAEEHAILGATTDGKVRVFWRQGPGLYSLDVREGSSPIKRNLRGVWHDAMGG